MNIKIDENIFAIFPSISKMVHIPPATIHEKKHTGERYILTREVNKLVSHSRSPYYTEYFSSHKIILYTVCIPSLTNTTRYKAAFRTLEDAIEWRDAKLASLNRLV